ncbi:hypothetical protein [Riemerella anatipestifer]|uniref:hypothetical protein n=1 Tax=Riemerella anatipestifer TaxID=34085 RepID=UPI0013727BF3|nr:hypothetical protein [Riemerella anatipestifer]MBT0550366.1 hypothetical protein [Riemerella anatipestifer]MBT0556736.1 hypothetical protein [Riemerella anatipestifer]MBT0561126.1 hypothetical protein [Riemerella anatipestifer]MCT6765633.1 hypothetical protein [Riemerella anatipestifer]MCT6769812.1 hypothetical protein [Riemerella anatipestifer]
MKSKKIRNARRLKVGGYYKCGKCNVLKIERKTDCCVFGVDIYISDDIVTVEMDALIISFNPKDGFAYEEITQEVFEQKLQEVQQKLADICDNIRKRSK